MKQEDTIQERKVTHLKDYTVPPWLVDSIHLTFDLEPKHTIVKSEIKIRRNPAGPAERSPLVLNGEEMELEFVHLNKEQLTESDYELSDSALTISEPPADEFELSIVCNINPEANTALSGLYMSAGMFCTQNEPEGFRKITYFIDRPDLMTVYKTTIIADKTKFPMLLANGNPVERKDLEDGRHQVVWEDPFAKPSYLFALVAGDFGLLKDIYTTGSGRQISCELYVDKGNEARARFAMDSLKAAMKWDEDTFGLEYDLDIYMIVAVEDFNFGAMENKGLNIFNARLVLADDATATDESFERIEGVIGHEYFHNWTGNRVTCRDWFQLTLKEGLTVYRDQEFTADMTEATVKRIKDVRDLREYQFSEDAGPMAHPIQPKSYLEINNFYTMTIYEKGAEVIRMIASLIGKDAFRKGIDKYFELFDGQAVTTGDFTRAMAEASGYDLTLFQRWYEQAGTPALEAREKYDAASKTYELTLTQKSINADGAEREPLLIPVRTALLDQTGAEMKLNLAGHTVRPGVDSETEVLILFAEKEITYVFKDVASAPVVSLLRGFSAPVKLSFKQNRKTLAFYLSKESDLFNRWEAGQKLAKATVNDMIADLQADRDPVADQAYVDAFGSLLSSDLPPLLLAELISLPDDTVFTNEQKISDFEATHQALKLLKIKLATTFKDQLLKIYETYHGKTYEDRGQGTGTRKLKNRCLGLLMYLPDEAKSYEICFKQQQGATNMTDELTSLSLLAGHESPRHEDSLKLFYEKWKHESLVMNNWFMVQANSSIPGTLERVRALQSDPVYNHKNPNRVRSLLGIFSRNSLFFNESYGSGYKLIADNILELDSINPGLAAGLSKAFSKIGKMDEGRKALAKKELQRILDHKGLSNDVYEIVDKCLKF